MSLCLDISALELPPESRVDQRIPKRLLLEQIDATAADKRMLQDGIEDLNWIAALKPVNIGVPEYRDEVREYLEIAVLSTTLRNAAKPRVIELIHRAIPYPVFLIAIQGETFTLTVAHKRWSQAETGRVVFEDLRSTGGLRLGERKPEESLFFESLALSALPRSNLFTLYQGWIDRVDALEAAQITGNFIKPDSGNIALTLRKDLDVYTRLRREVSLLRTQAAKEKQLNRRVELNLAIKRIETELTTLTERLRH
jgi:hypothetical protein